MSEELCRERVTHAGVWHSVRCSRRAGHGKDGLYCRQHALKHPAGAQETQRWWKVSRWSDEPEPVEVVKSSAKTIVLKNGYRARIIGDSESYYRSRLGALVALEARVDRKVESTQRTLQRLLADQRRLRELLEEEERRLA